MGGCLLATYRDTLQSDRRSLFDHFTLTDVADKVVGVGSVGPAPGSCCSRPAQTLKRCCCKPNKPGHRSWPTTQATRTTPIRVNESWPANG